MNFYEAPIMLESTRVARTYRGGLLLERWLGLPAPADGRLPEDWLASDTPAVNGFHSDVPVEGLSVFITDGRPLTLKDAVSRRPDEMLGKAHVRAFGSSLTILAKMLDAAERLTIQIHPDKRMAKDLFQSDYGKTECWYVADTRDTDGEPPYVLLGFREGMSERRFRALFEAEKYDEMVGGMVRLPVGKGEVYLIDALMPHAIGGGALILEIQEPTDLTLRAERSTPSGLRIGDELCHLGVGYDKMFARINYQGFTEQEVRRRFQIRPVTVASGDGFREDILIGPSRTDCFSMRRLTVSETCPYRNTADRFVIAAALSGEGVLRHGGREIPILPGNRLFLPACVKETAFTARGAGALVLVLCFPRAL